LQPPPSTILQKLIPHQGVMNTQQEINATPPQMGKYQNPIPNQPRNLVDRNILHTNEEDILLQTHSRKYKIPPESTPTTLETTLDTSRQPLMIPHPNTEPNPCIPCVPLRWNVHNPHARATHNYIFLDDLTQSPATMYVLEVLQTCPYQQKSMLSTLGEVDPTNN
jgi:hypothetical protein